MKRILLLCLTLLLALVLPAAAEEASLARGAEGDQVAALQRALRLSGFSSADPDGQFDAALEQEVNACRKALGLSATGAADEEMLSLLESAPLPASPIERGDKGDDVKRLQNRLIVLNCLTDTADGSFGRKTDAALRLFQEVNGLSATGTADEETIARLFSADATPGDKRPYRICVSLEEQTLAVWAYNPETTEFDVEALSASCSTGANGSTPTGVFLTQAPTSYEWIELEGGSWIRYVSSLEKGPRISSIEYARKRAAAPFKRGLLSLGTPVTSGDIYLLPEDAQWIWENCPKGVEVWIG